MTTYNYAGVSVDLRTKTSSYDEAEGVIRAFWFTFLVYLVTLWGRIGLGTDFWSKITFAVVWKKPFSWFRLVNDPFGVGNSIVERLKRWLIDLFYIYLERLSNIPREVESFTFILEFFEDTYFMDSITFEVVSIRCVCTPSLYVVRDDCMGCMSSWVFFIELDTPLVYDTQFFSSIEMLPRIKCRQMIAFCDLKNLWCLVIESLWFMGWWLWNGDM